MPTPSSQEEVFNKVYSRTKHFVRWYCRRWAVDGQLFDDFVQEIFLRVWKFIRAGHEIRFDAVSALLKTIMVRFLMRNRNKYSLHLDYNHTADALLELRVNRSYEPGHPIRLATQSCLDIFTGKEHKFRDILRLHFLERNSTRTLATAEGVDISTIFKRVEKAKKLVQRRHKKVA